MPTSVESETDRRKLATVLRLIAALSVLLTTTLAMSHDVITGMTARATSEQVKGLYSAANVCSDNGLSDSGRGDGSRKLTTNGYAEGGNGWHSGYIARGAEESPIIEFDLGKVETVGRFHVWNHNGSPHRGFKHVSMIVSEDGKSWRPVAQRFEFAKAPKSDDYLGEDYSFEPPVTARFIRFHCDGTHRIGGQPDLAGLGKVRFYRSERGLGLRSEQFGTKGVGLETRPTGAGFIDVTAAPYFAKADGVTDDTDAIQRAIDDWQGQHRMLFLPSGTFLVTKPLRYKPGVGNGYNTFRGAGRERTILRLKDAMFTDAEKPRPVLSFGFNGREDGTGVHADWFNNNVADLTIDTGRDNPGAVGLQFYSNNVGSCRDVTIQSSDAAADKPGGAIGLDLGYADQNGPLLVKNVSVDGFAIGVKTGATVNSQTLEHVTVTNATRVGFENHGQCLSIRGLRVTGPSLAFVSHFGVVALIDSELRGRGVAGEHPAIATGETLFARNVKTSGFKLAIENKRQKDNATPSAPGPNVEEWVSTSPLSLFENKRPRSLNLPILETPDVASDEVAAWANVRCFREIDDPDDSTSIQRAIDSGATTVYFPSGAHFFISQPVELRGSARRIVGHFSGIHPVKSKTETDAQPALRIGDGPSPVVVVQDLTGELHIEHASQRTLVVKNGQGIGGVLSGCGDLFLENVVGDWTFERGRAWARQFNNERLGTHLLNKQSTLWILGLKTERGGTLIETQAGGQTELIGGLSYTTNNGKLAPMFVSTDAAVSYTIGEVCYSGNPFTQLVQETRAGETKLIKRGDAPFRPSYLQGSQIPLFVGTGGGMR